MIANLVKHGKHFVIKESMNTPLLGSFSADLPHRLLIFGKRLRTRYALWHLRQETIFVDRQQYSDALIHLVTISEDVVQVINNAVIN
jgi:hypothetical protein